MTGVCLNRVLQWLSLIAISIFIPLDAAPRKACADDAMSTEPSSHVVVVVGASGTPEYGDQFAKWAGSWRSVAEQAEASITLIGQSENGDTNDHDQLRETLARLSNTNRGNVWLILIGHGTFARNTAKFNLRGPDVTATELGDWVKKIKRPVVVVNCASASGPFINQLSGNNRVIVTATKNGTEQNYARFGEFIAKSIASPDSDLDHDGEVSIHEAFLKANVEVQQFYESEGRISTEHALIDDNGDGLGTPAKMFRGTRPIGKPKDNVQLDGLNASTMTLAPADQRLPFTQAELNKRRDLESQLAELKQRNLSSNSEEIDDAAYQAELETLMVKLAKLYRAAEQRQEATNPKSQ